MSRFLLAALLALPVLSARADEAAAPAERTVTVYGQSQSFIFSRPNAPANADQKAQLAAEAEADSIAQAKVACGGVDGAADAQVELVGGFTHDTFIGCGILFDDVTATFRCLP